MISPALLGYLGQTAADNDNIVGPIIASVAFTALFEATRGLRWGNLPLGAWLLLAPWVLGYDSTAAIVNNMLVGACVAALSLVGGRVEQQFGGGWSALFTSDSLHAREAKKQDGRPS
nr:SPW repeat protein [Cesiribacter andamanensis]